MLVAARSLGISPGRFLQFSPILPNTIPMPTERKSHSKKIRKIDRSGRLDPEHPSAGIKQQEFTSHPGKMFGEKTLNNPVWFSCPLLSVPPWCGRAAAHRGKAMLKLLLCCQG